MYCILKKLSIKRAASFFLSHRACRDVSNSNILKGFRQVELTLSHDPNLERHFQMIVKSFSIR